MLGADALPVVVAAAEARRSAIIGADDDDLTRGGVHDDDHDDDGSGVVPLARAVARCAAKVSSKGVSHKDLVSSPHE